MNSKLKVLAGGSGDWRCVWVWVGKCTGIAIGMLFDFTMQEIHAQVCRLSVVF